MIECTRGTTLKFKHFYVLYPALKICTCRAFQTGDTIFRRKFTNTVTYTYISRVFSFLFSFSGVIQVAVPARGQIETVWHAMTATSVHVVTRAAVASARPRLSLVTQCVSSVMATAAVSRLDLDSWTTSACVRLQVCAIQEIDSQLQTNPYVC